MKHFFSLIFLVLVGFASGLWGAAVLQTSWGQAFFTHWNGPQTVHSGATVVQNTSTNSTNLESLDAVMIPMIQKSSSSVVSVIATKDVPIMRQNPSMLDPFFQEFFSIPEGFLWPNDQQPESGQTERRKMGGGTAFIISKEWLLLTNKHVVADESASYTVVLNDGTLFAASVLYRDPAFDAAVLKLGKQVDQEGKEKKDARPVTLVPLEIGSSESTQIGQTVVAIGNALAEYQNTVTSGIVSAKNRKITAGGGMGPEILTGLIQTDAAINPWNSGGPLLNLAGQVIGINTAIDATARGIGFAIPIDDIKPMIESLQKDGTVVRSFLGLRYQLLSRDRLSVLWFTVPDKYDRGAIVVGDVTNSFPWVIKDSPADKAGLRAKDIIVMIDGQNLSDEITVPKALARKKPGDTVTVTFIREEKEQTVTVVLGSFPLLDEKQTVQEQ